MGYCTVLGVRQCNCFVIALRTQSTVANRRICSPKPAICIDFQKPLNVETNRSLVPGTSTELLGSTPILEYCDALFVLEISILVDRINRIYGTSGELFGRVVKCVQKCACDIVNCLRRRSQPSRVPLVFVVVKVRLTSGRL